MTYAKRKNTKLKLGYSKVRQISQFGNNKKKNLANYTISLCDSDGILF